MTSEETDALVQDAFKRVLTKLSSGGYVRLTAEEEIQALADERGFVFDVLVRSRLAHRVRDQLALMAKRSG